MADTHPITDDELVRAVNRHFRNRTRYKKRIADGEKWMRENVPPTDQVKRRESRVAAIRSRNENKRAWPLDAIIPANK